MAFPSTLFFVGERLVSHTIANISVIDRDTCEYRCYLDHNCVSVNFYFGEKGAKAHNCELNNSTGNEYGKNLVKAADYVYHGTKVPVAKCQLHNSLFFQFIRAKGVSSMFMSVKRLLFIICYFLHKFQRSADVVTDLLYKSTIKKQKSYECLENTQLY